MTKKLQKIFIMDETFRYLSYRELTRIEGCIVQYESLPSIKHKSVLVYEGGKYWVEWGNTYINALTVKIYHNGSNSN